MAMLFLSGCGTVSLSGSPAPSQETDSAAETGPGSSDMPLTTLDELPLRFPQPSREEKAQADDVSEPTADAPGLIDTLRGTVDASPIFEETGAQESLLDSLDAAQEQLTRAQRDNRRALREANRQVRVGSSRASPHLLLITLSDVAYADVGVYGGPDITPHLDDFAAAGMRFTDFYASSAQPRAARWSLLTGLNVGHAPQEDEMAERFRLPATEETLGDVLWKSGYSTGFVGIWRDTSLPLDHGSDEWAGLMEPRSTLDPFPEFLYVDATKARLLPNADGQDELAVIDFLLDEAIVSLTRRSEENRPCFLHLAVSPELLPDSDAVGLHETRTESRLRQLDSHLGRLFSQLDATGLSGRTCIVVAGETTPTELLGEPAARSRSGPFRTSADGLSEGNLRVPLIVRWPGHVPADTVSDHVCAAWDLLPTLADLAAAQRRPSRLDGLSFASELQGRTQREHSLLYWETREAGFGQAVRKGDWKGVRAPGTSSLALYNLSSDPGEQADVADEYPEIVRQFIVSRR